MRSRYLLLSLLLLGMLVVVGCSDNAGATTILASANGVSVAGDPQAVPPGVTLSVNLLTRDEAAASSPLPTGALFAAAAECLPEDVQFLRPVTLAILLPNALAPGAHFPAYRLSPQGWEPLGPVASVSSNGITVSLPITQGGSYLVALNDQYSALTVDDTTLIYQAQGLPETNLRNPRVLATGKVTDPAVLAMVEQITGRTEAQAVELLRSFDTGGDKVVQVLELTESLYVTRYWGPADKLGRWYAPVENSTLLTPDEARRLLALPNTNNAYNVTLYKLKPGTKLISGSVADMSANPEVFGPYATGGGWQYYVPDATVWVVDHPELNPQTTTLISEARFVQP